MRQTIVVLGDPFLCWQCKAPASVMLAKENEDNTHSSVPYCDTCWLYISHAYSPLTMRDGQQAILAAEAFLGGDDDQQKSGVRR